MRRKRISAQDALAWGLVSEVVPAPTSSTTRSAGSSTICSSFRRSRSRSAKRVLNLAYDGPLHLGLEIEGLAYGMLRSSDDFAEGVDAFV